MNRIKTVFQKLWSYETFHIFMYSIALNAVIECLNNRGLTGLLKIFTSPVIFLMNTLIIMTTLSIGLFFKRRIFVYVLMAVLWIILAFINFVVLYSRKTPFTAMDIYLISDAIKVIPLYINVFQMILIVVGIIAVISGLVMLFKRTFYCFNFIFMYGYEDRESKNWSVKKIMKWAGAGIGSLLVLIALISAFYSISPGYRGVLITLGKVSQHSYINGVGFKWPFVSSMIKMDVRTRKMTDKTSTYTSDIQTADLEYTFTYDLNPENIHILYEKVGLDYEAKAILPSLNDVLKDVIGKWQAQELVANRDKARVDVVAGLQERLDRRFFQNITFQFINIDYSDKFEGAIEDKVIAEQKAQEAVNNTKRIKEEAEQKLISAKAEAEAMEIKSEALSKNKGLTEYEAVQKWDGKLPQYMLGNSTPFVNLSGK